MNVLDRVFGEVLRLENWLNNVAGLCIQNEQFEKCLKDFEKIYVGCQSERKQFAVVSLSQHFHQYEIILRTIQKILKKKEVCKNVLTFGFSTISDNSNASTWQDIESKYPNTSVKVLQSSSWKTLLMWIGDETMLYMLEHLSIFMEVKPTCFVQLTGTPVYELWSFKKGQVLKLEKTIQPSCKKKQKNSKNHGTEKSKTEKENSGMSLQSSKRITFKQLIRKGSVVGKGYDSLIERSKNYANLKKISSGMLQNVTTTDGKLLAVAVNDQTPHKVVDSDGEVLSMFSSNGKLLDMAASYGKLLDVAATDGKLQNDVATNKNLCITDEPLTGQNLNTDLHVEGESSISKCLYIENSEENERMETESFETLCDHIKDAGRVSSHDQVRFLKAGSLQGAKGLSENFDEKSEEIYRTFSSHKRKRVLEEFDLPAKKIRKLPKDEIEAENKTDTSEGSKNSPSDLRPSSYEGSWLQNSEGGVEAEQIHFQENSVSSENINPSQHLPSPHTSNTRNMKARDYSFKSFECDEMAQRKVEPINETCHSCLIFNWPRSLCTIYAQSPMVILPRKKLMYNINIREKIPKSALISRFKYSPDSVLALYKSIFVESNEVINKSIQVVPQSMSDIMAILDTPSQNLRPENEKATSTANTESNIFVKVAPDSNIAAGSDRRILPLLSQFLLKLQKCPYKALLNHYCPVSARFDNRKRPQAGKTYVKGFYKRQVQKEDVSRHLNEHVHKRQVYLFVRACLQHILPVQLIGCVRNRNLILKRVSECLSMGKYDKMSLGQLMIGLRTKKVDWLQTIHSNSCRLYLLSRLVYWLFVNVIFVLLRTCFYTTDTTFLRYKVLYYRQVVWNRIKFQGLRGLMKKGTLTPIPKSEVQKLIQTKESLGVSTLRFLPKEKSLRPIINMGVISPEFSSKKLSVNKQLTDVHLVLTYLKDRNQSLLGYGKLGTDEIHSAWNQFKQNWRGQGQPDLYFVKTDISRCYDSILQPKLFQIMEKIFDEELADEELMITRYVTVSSRKGFAWRRFRRKVFSLCDFEPNIKRHATNLLGAESNTVLVDKMCHEFETGKGLLNILKSHCSHNIIKHGSKYYLHTEGISQGSVVSTLLCNFYYADMERKLFKVKDTEFLVRIIDDYLFVTPDEQSAVNFLKCMLNGIPEYNCHTNTEKVVINFQYNEKEMSVPKDDWFPWCGMLFNTKTLEVAVDYDRYTGISVTDTMTFDLTQNPGRAMKEKLVYSVQQKFHGIYIDPAINSEDQITANLFYMFVFASLRLHAILRKMPSKGTKGLNLTLFEDIIKSVTNITMSNLNKFQHSDRCQTLGPYTHTFHAVRWLCVHGFAIGLNQHKAQNIIMLKSLKKWCKKCEMKMPKEIVKQMRSVCGTELPENFKLMLN